MSYTTYNKFIAGVLAIAMLIVSLPSGTTKAATLAEDKRPLQTSVEEFWNSLQDNEKQDETVTFPTAGERTPKKLRFTLTAYNSVPGQTDATPCITANGHDLCRQYEEYGDGNTLATNMLPFGTVVRIPELFGDKEFVVRDRMNARYNGTRRMDVWLPEFKQAKQFGVKRNVEISVY